VVGTGDTLAVLGIQVLISACVLGAAYYLALVLALPLAYVWLAELLGWAICLAAAWGWMRSGYWARLDV